MATPVSPRLQPQAPVAAATPRWRPSLRTCLVVLVLAALLPALLAAALALGRAASAYREASQARLLDTARTLARAVENELANRYMVMRTLAAPPPARVADAAVAVTREPWLRRWGTELGGELWAAAELDARMLADPAAGAVIRATLDTALRTGRTEVSNLYADAAVAGPRIAIAAPGVAGAAGALVLEIAPQRLVRALQSRTSEASALLIAVTDGSGRIVARSQDAARAVGKPVPDWARLQARGTDHGLFEARTVEGQPIVFAFEKLRDTPGWVVVVGEPLAAFDARWQEPLIGLAAGGAVALGLSLLAVAWLTRLILRPVQALVTHARQVAENRPALTAADPAPSAIDEFETLRSSLATADRVLQQRAQAERASSLALQASEQRYRTLVESGALMFWRCDARGRLTAADGWHELTGVAEPQALGAGWQAHLHPDDRRATRAAWRAAQAPGRALDVECRIGTAGGDWRWVRARGAPIVGDRGEVTEWVGVLEDVDERRRAQARVTHMAHHDALTGLPNRALLQERLVRGIL